MFFESVRCLLGFATVLAVRAHRIFRRGWSVCRGRVAVTVANVFVFVLRRDGGESDEEWDEEYGMTFLFRATLFTWTWIFFAGGLKQIFIDIDWENEVPAYAWGGVLFSGFGSAVIAHGINSWAITRVNGVLPTCTRASKSRSRCSSG